MQGNNARAYMNYLKDIGIPFEMICSNYTVEFIADGLERKFIASDQSKRTFAAFAKIKSDVKKKPVPEIDKDALKYFIHDFRSNIYIGDVINIDLKSAYATVLHNDGYILRSTYDYISNCSKQERLVSVGMLASKKQKFKFDAGRIITHEEIVSENSNYFYYAVKRTGEIMEHLKLICKENYLFTWVDGIYMLPDIETMQACEKYIESIGFKYTTEQLRNFETKIFHDHVTVTFEKFSKGEWKRKPFNLPHIDNGFKRLIIDAILSRKNKTK
jgi:hypothetical protein